MAMYFAQKNWSDNHFVDTYLFAVLAIRVGHK